MDLTALPARLTEEQAKEWSAWIFEMTETSHVKALAAELEENNEKVKSVRSELSKFLNGHTHIVERWLGGKRSEKGEALCGLLGETAESLLARYEALIPPPRAVGLSPQHLNHLPIRLAREELAKSLSDLRKELNIEAKSPIEDSKALSVSWTELRDYLLDIAGPTASTPPPEIKLSVEPSRDRDSHHRGHESCALALLTRRVERLAEDHGGSFTFEGENHSYSRNPKELKLKVLPLSHQDFNAGLDTLRGLALTPNEEAEKLRDFFSQVSEPTLDAFSPDHLLRAIEDFREGRLTDPATRALHSRRIEWERHTLQASAEPHAQKWLQRTSPTFLRWLHIAGSLQSQVSREELNRILEVKTSKDFTITNAINLLERVLLNDKDELPPERRTQILQLLPNALVLALVKSKLLKEIEVDDRQPHYQLTRIFFEFAELETALHLTPEHLKNLEVNPNARLVSDAVSLAKPESLNAWYKQAIETTGINQPEAMLAVLEGLAMRNDLEGMEADDALTMLWASALWAKLHGLHDPENRPDTSLQTTFAARISPLLRHALPRLGDKTTALRCLKAFVAPSILKAVKRWNPAPSLDSEKTDTFLFEHAPFQISPIGLDEATLYELEYRHEDDCPSHPVAHLAMAGDPYCQKAILTGTEYNSLKGAPTLASRVQWLHQHLDADLAVEQCSCTFRPIIEDALKTFATTPTPELLYPLRTLLSDDRFFPLLPPLVREVVATVSDGPITALIWLFDQRERRFPSNWLTNPAVSFVQVAPSPDEIRWPETPEDILLTLIEILNKADFLQELVELTIENFQKEPRALFLLTKGQVITSSNEPHPRPALTFPAISQFMNLRHRALLLLAKLNSPSYLIASLKAPFAIKFDFIATQRALFDALYNAMADPYNGIRAPSDSEWEELLNVLHRIPVNDDYRHLSSDSRLWGSFSEIDRKSIYILAIRNAPEESRWGLLKPLFKKVWELSLDKDCPQVLKHLKNDLPPRSSTNQESDIWIKERESWALRHHKAYIRSWADTPYNLSLVAEDLEWADAIWHHLTLAQQRNLLIEIPKSFSEVPLSNTAQPLPEHWIERSEILPLDEKLTFARRHQNLPGRRAVAKTWFEHAEGDRLENFLSLNSDERPDPSCIKAEIDQLLTETVRTAPVKNVLETLGDLICTPSTSLRSRILPIYLEKRAHHLISTQHSLTDLESKLSTAPPSSFLKTLSDDFQANLSSSSLRKVEEKVQALKKRIVTLAGDVEAKENRVLFPKINPILDTWVDRVVSALFTSKDKTSDMRSRETLIVKELAALQRGEKIKGFEPDQFTYALSNETIDECLPVLLTRTELAVNMHFLQDIIHALDRSTLPASTAEAHANQWLSAYEQTCDDPRHMIAMGYWLSFRLRRPNLRQIVRDRAGALSMADSGHR
ncbi:hypothetical protein FRC96_00615 [Lujinxingia vulgaris]|uniref:Uncharacterized protein n=1 Tax=Lujinxingia vulgaris TaxID=2600176 RepID=A0A5C6XTE5_9DELT|nr:hypothetical protein [Lujinxingia vulgaris]TXD44286.1 hypothetical protein FRC96_00615 [Lujinxingia vulgaris]